MSPKGVFISFEGLDGSGKTTQLRLLSERLRASGKPVLETAEPGGTGIGRALRKLLLDPTETSLTSRAELLLYCASRAQNVDEVIRPALKSNVIVLADRFSDSALAYQGAGRSLGIELAASVDRVATGGLTPDLTLLLDLDAAASLARLRELDRMDREAPEFYCRVADAYRRLAIGNPGRFRILDARAPIGEVSARIWEIVEPYVS